MGPSLIRVPAGTGAWGSCTRKRKVIRQNQVSVVFMHDVQKSCMMCRRAAHCAPASHGRQDLLPVAEKVLLLPSLKT